MSTMTRHRPLTLAALTLTTAWSTAFQGAAAQEQRSERSRAPQDANGQLVAVGANAYVRKISAFGFYYDAETQEYVVAVPADKDVPAREEVTKALGTTARAVQLKLSKSALASIEQQVWSRTFHPKATDYSYAMYLDLPSGMVIVITTAPASVTQPLLNEFPNVIKLQSGMLRQD